MINEDGVATNSMASGQIAGAGIDNPNRPNQAEPGVSKNKKKKLREIVPLFKRKP